MSLYVSTTNLTPGEVLTTADYDARVIAYAVLAGIILYLINKSFIANIPPYVSIIVGIFLTVYLYNYAPINYLGIALMADGFYKLLKTYVVINS